MKFAQFCIKHPVTTIMAYVMIVIFGLLGFSSLPLALMPDIDLPMAIITTSYTGAGPDEVENLITKPLESACASTAGMDKLQSTSNEGSSMIAVSFANGTDMDEALTSLRDKIDQVKSFLPEDASKPVVMKMKMTQAPLVYVGLEGADLAQLQKIAENDLAPRLERIDGVASVNIYGGYENEVAIYTHKDKMNGYGLSISYISQMLSAQNIAIPAGEVKNGTQTISVRTTGEFKSVDDIANVLLPLPKGGSIRLGDIADVYLKNTKQDEISKVDGKPCVIIDVKQQSDANSVKVAEKVKAQFDDFTSENPTLNSNILFDASKYINKSVDAVVQNILFGVLLAGIVLLVFLRDFGATAVISISMPVCIISVFMVMTTMKITMNMMSLGGLAMGVGMIVDNSIVVLENIFRYRSDGFSRLESCIQGTGEVALSITAGTLTTIAVFLPIGLSGGLAGMIFKEFSITISSLLFASLVIALTLVPLMCYILLDRAEGKHKLITRTKSIDDRPLMKKYKSLLKFFITKRKVGVIASIAMVLLFSVSIFVAGFEMLPETDEGGIMIYIDMPVGSKIEQTAEFSDRVSKIAMDTIPEIKTLSYTATSYGQITIDIGAKAERKRGVKEIIEKLRKDTSDIAGCDITINAMSSFGFSSGDGGGEFAVTLKGDDYKLLNETGKSLVKELEKLDDAIGVSSTAGKQIPQVEITLKPTSAVRYGLTASQVGQAVRSELAGATATKLKVNGNEITVSVKGDERSSQSIDALKTASISTQSGALVPLSTVADVNIVLAPQEIVRKNQSRTITVSCNSRSGDIVAINQSANQIVQNFDLPEGITFENSGEMQDMTESFITLGKALIAGLVLIYFVLASQFESFIMPVIVMMILPVGLIGSLVGLPLTAQKISMMAFIGVIMLSGTVVNSSIVLVDYINTRRSRGESKNEAILNACPRRVRPVLMTTLTTILGLVPMVLDNGDGSELMSPMAVVMITGMVISTIVTLLFTPVYYSIIDSISQRFKNRKNKKLTKNTANI